MEDAKGQTVSLRIAGCLVHRRERRVRRVGHRDHVPRLPRRVRGGPRRDRGEGRRRAPPAELAEGDARRAEGARAAGSRDESACALHGGDARANARGARHRPPVDVRVDPRHDPRPRLRLQEGHGARAVVPRVLGRAAARAALRPARRLRLHGAHGGRPRPHRVGRRAAQRVAQALLLRRERRRRRNDGGLHELVSDLGGIDAREINSIPIGDGIVGARRPLRPVPRARATSARAFPTIFRPTS